MRRQVANHIFALVAVSLVSCKDSGTEPSEILFHKVDGYENFYIPDEGTTVIRDDSTWMRYWRDYWNLYSDIGKVPPPTVDFSEKMVLAVFYGANYSGCSNKVEVIEDIRLDRNHIRVQLGPLPFLGYCRAIVAPIQMATISKSNLEVVFVGNVPS